jgi:hypothetical protein
MMLTCHSYITLKLNLISIKTVERGYCEFYTARHVDGDSVDATLCHQHRFRLVSLRNGHASTIQADDWDGGVECALPRRYAIIPAAPRFYSHQRHRHDTTTQLTRRNGVY